jgi:uncharacterized DUF497 family protein
LAFKHQQHISSREEWDEMHAEIRVETHALTIDEVKAIHGEDNALLRTLDGLELRDERPMVPTRAHPAAAWSASVCTADDAARYRAYRARKKARHETKQRISSHEEWDEMRAEMRVETHALTLYELKAIHGAAPCSI